MGLHWAQANKRWGRGVTSLFCVVTIPLALHILYPSSHVQDVPTASTLPLPGLIVTSIVIPGLWQLRGGQFSQLCLYHLPLGLSCPQDKFCLHGAPS